MMITWILCSLYLLAGFLIGVVAASPRKKEVKE